MQKCPTCGCDVEDDGSVWIIECRRPGEEWRLYSPIKVYKSEHRARRAANAHNVAGQSKVSWRATKFERSEKPLAKSASIE